jgi:hypothetical protein
MKKAQNQCFVPFLCDFRIYLSGRQDSAIPLNMLTINELKSQNKILTDLLTDIIAKELNAKVDHTAPLAK